MSSEFTFQSESNGLALEDLEWDNTWWEQAPDKSLPRVLYIGDSISCGTRRQATFAAESKILFDGFGSSKALDNPYFEDSLRLFAKQQGYRQAVLFNNGLHGWHLEDSGSYAEYYLKTLRFLKAEFKNTPVAVVLTTAVADPIRNDRVKERNKAAVSAAAPPIGESQPPGKPGRQGGGMGESPPPAQVRRPAWTLRSAPRGGASLRAGNGRGGTGRRGLLRVGSQKGGLFP